ncbi:methionine synthase [uncultured Alistipes sp.]|uniref:methionine synthase n=1 Tax=uncultured Alistipes sp. TaxID=538949 RepID=UPI00320922B5
MIPTDTKNDTLQALLARRILLLDGGFGTMVQGYGLQEEAYRGERFRTWDVQLKGCNDLLALTRPEVVREIHEKYLAAGADIIETDSFNANAVSLADYRLEAFAYEMSRAAAEVARAAADAFTARNPQKPRFVVGSMGPTNRTASMSADVANPAAREVTFRQLVDAYTEQARGLMDGGADVLLVETVFDTLNAKAALYAIDRLCEARGQRIPVMVSGTLADASGRTLSGQTVEAFAASVAHARLLSIGLNCAYGARQLMPYLERLAAVAETRISAHPNAGLPNVMGGYDETPEMFAEDVGEYMRRGLVNIVGGCCGTTPAHILELAKIVGRYTPRPLPEPRHETVLAGLEPLRVVPEANFINIGERTNVAGSAKFARLIREGNYEEALSVARAQVEAGAQVVDVCMDDGLIDGPAAMRTFLNLMASEPEIARVPVMVDSSKWEVLQAGLEVTQGKSVVNSISLKEGEAEFLRRAAEIHRYGAAAVVMLFDERGQADTFERKIEVAERAYRLLTENGFPAEDIIFDPNVLAVATGIPEHDGYAKAFIDATRWIKEHLPHAKVSGGVSNLSFAFRGNNAVREAMHSAFLYHAIRAGMDMGIVNPQMLRVYSEIEPALLERVEDVILCRRADAAERLTEYAHEVQQTAQTQPQAPDAWRSGSLEERIDHAMLKGIADWIEADALEGYQALGSPMEVIDRLLMPAMERVGVLFGEGKMFLPQVVKTARVMKRAVAVLTPYIEQGAAVSAHSAGKVVIATVKGDVHDIGKNIVAVVMACNGYEIRDLGVMVEAERIVDEAVAWGAQAICLSGLITPSLDEMAHVCQELERRGLRIPVIIGGATTSELHTAVKIAPVYSGAVVHSANASQNTQILARLTGDGAEAYVAEVKQKQASLREEYARRLRERDLIPIVEVRKARRGAPAHQPVKPLHPGRMVFPDFDIADAEPFIDWNFFFPAWGLKGHYPEILDHSEKGAEARKLFDDAQALLARISDQRLLTLQGVVGIFPARAEKDDIIVTDTKGREKRLPMLRNQTRGEENRSLADWIAPQGDWIGCFALTAGIGLKKLEEQFRSEGDDYSAILSKLLADRLTEAFAEAVHTFVRRQMWGYETSEKLDIPRIIRGDYRGRRMAFGYPASPDHSLKREVFDLLAVEATTGMHLTENWMIDPGEALCGLMFADAEYFSVGTIDTKQLLDYARRRGLEVEQIKKLIPNNL